jgi:hypothetical protein
MAVMDENDRQRRIEFIRNVKGALKQGVSSGQREVAREQKANAWVDWFHAHLDQLGGETAQHLPDALAELEERISDEVAGALREFKAALVKALK